MISRALVSTTLFALALSTLANGQTTYYVNGVCGDDAWSGTDPSCVPPNGPKATISAAIGVAADHDEIIVAPGTYPELINTGGLAITLRSADGSDVTIIDGQGAGTVVTCNTDEDPNTVIAGFKIIGGAGDQGGGMHIVNSSPTVIQCAFLGNAAQYGGGLFNHHGSPTLIECAFIENTASASAGGMYNYGYPGQPSATLIDCEFNENTAETIGGGMRNWDSSPTLTRCTFYYNHARYSGAGVANGGVSSPALTNCMFLANRADALFGAWDAHGGGMYNAEDSSPTLVSCAFVSNSAVALLPALSYGGALANDGNAGPQLVNCTLKANHANIGDGLHNAQNSNPTVTSSILWDGVDEVVDADLATTLITYSAVQGGWPGVGNITDDPLLDDTRLLPGSPCINTGDPNSDPAAPPDLDGHARVLCGRVDMGAYEFGIGDYTCDQVIDTADLAGWPTCMTGPDNPPYGAGCETLDFEYDHDVDLVDFAAFQELPG